MDSEAHGQFSELPEFSQIQTQKRGRVALLTLNRPERLNAWTYTMSDELCQALDAGNTDSDIGAFVLTGTGRGFCAGADIEATFDKRSPEAFNADPDKAQRDPNDWVQLIRTSKPVVAAVNGAAVGIGATMIAPCDVILAGKSARFAMAFIKMGLVPELASSHFLVQRMGFGRASEMCLTGQLYSAADSVDMGFADRLVADDDLLSDALALAESMAANPSRQLRWVKQLLTENGSDTDLAAVQKRELTLLREAQASDEHKAAVASFMNRSASSSS